jgi:hypothetical protein
MRRASLIARALAAAIAVLGIAAAASAQDTHEKRDVRPHASAEFVPYVHASGGYRLEHPADWKTHEGEGRTNIGADDGLVKGERGYRTIYGVIVLVVDDPLAGRAERSVEASTRLIVEQVLTRNPHQKIVEPVAADRPLGGAPAFRAVLNGTSPVTGRGERAEIVARHLDDARVFYLVLVSPVDDHAKLAPALGRLRDSVRIPGR